MKLGHDTRDGEVRCIRFQDGLKIRVEMTQDGGGCEASLQTIKSLLTRLSPLPGGVLTGQVCERNRKTRVPFNEPSVEVREAQKAANVLNSSRCLPFQNRFYLLPGHAHSLRRDDVSQELHRRCFEHTLLNVCG